MIIIIEKYVSVSNHLFFISQTEIKNHGNFLIIMEGTFDALQMLLNVRYLSFSPGIAFYWLKMQDVAVPTYLALLNWETMIHILGKQVFMEYTILHYR